MDFAGCPAVTVRITLLDGDSVADRHIRVEGRLTGEAVAELERLVGGDLHSTCLDLEDLRAVDAAALLALRRMRAAGVEMHGANPHLTWQIEEEP
jgi:hypothetical protein